MQIDHSGGISTQHNLPGPFHHTPVESHIIDIQSVDTHIVDQPVKPFQIIIMPARSPRIDDRGIAQLRNKPCRNVIPVEMLLQPGVAAARTVRKNFIAERFQCPDLGTAVRKLAHRVINLHFILNRMCRIDIRFHLRRPQERVIDEWIDGCGMVNVDHVGSSLADRIQRHVFMVIPVMPLLCRVDLAERGQENVNIEMQRFPCFHRSFATVSGQFILLAVAGELNAALALIIPRWRHVQRLLMVEIGIQRPLIILGPESCLDACIHRPKPGPVAVEIRIPPVPELIRGFAALLTQPEHILHMLFVHGYNKFNI